MRNQRHDIDVDQIRRQEKLARYERRMLNYTYDHDEYELRQARRRTIGSVLSEGEYQSRVEEGHPAPFPKERPYYE